VAGKDLQEITMMKFNVPDMTCGHCVASLTKAVKALDPAAAVTADLADKTVTVETAVPAAAVARALDQAGYPNTAL
jgi:copper chaperone